MAGAWQTHGGGVPRGKLTITRQAELDDEEDAEDAIEGGDDGTANDSHGGGIAIVRCVCRGFVTAGTGGQRRQGRRGGSGMEGEPRLLLPIRS